VVVIGPGTREKERGKLEARGFAVPTLAGFATTLPIPFHSSPAHPIIQSIQSDNNPTAESTPPSSPASPSRAPPLDPEIPPSSLPSCAEFGTFAHALIARMLAHPFPQIPFAD
jgi:hypothetical protein